MPTDKETILLFSFLNNEEGYKPTIWKVQKGNVKLKREHINPAL